MEAWVEDAKQLIKGLLERMRAEAEVKTVLHDRDLLVDIQGDREGLLIGKGGRTLDALQTLISRMINKQHDGSVRVVIDIDGYKKRRSESLTRMAMRSGEIVRATGKAVVVGPFTAQDRRVIHLALQESPHVTTESMGEGEGNIKKIRIIPKKKEGGEVRSLE